VTDDALTDLFHRVELRLEGLDRRVKGLDKRLASVESRLASIETRLDDKASQQVVSWWSMTVMGWTSIMVGAAVALVKLWP